MFTASLRPPTCAQLKASGYDDGYGKRPGRSRHGRRLQQEGRRGRSAPPVSGWSGATPDLENGPEIQQSLVRADLPVANTSRNRGFEFVPQKVWVAVSRKVDDVPWFGHALANNRPARLNPRCRFAAIFAASAPLDKK